MGIYCPFFNDKNQKFPTIIFRKFTVQKQLKNYKNENAIYSA